MDARNVNTTLSSGIEILSRFSQFTLQYIIYQIKFLKDFEYSKVNIERHLMDKAMKFFDMEPSDDQKPLKKGRIKQKINRLKSKIEKYEKDQKERTNCTNSNRSGHRKKINIYRPPG